LQRAPAKRTRREAGEVGAERVLDRCSAARLARVIVERPVAVAERQRRLAPRKSSSSMVTLADSRSAEKVRLIGVGVCLWDTWTLARWISGTSGVGAGPLASMNSRVAPTVSRPLRQSAPLGAPFTEMPIDAAQ